MKNFFRKDLNLNTKWWHRLLTIVFFSGLAYFIYDSSVWSFKNYRGYTEKEKVTTYANNNIQLLGDLPKNNLKYTQYIVSKGKPYREENDTYFNTYKDTTFCSDKISENFTQLLDQNGGVQKWELYSGEMLGRNKLSIDEYKKYLESTKIKCLTLDSYTGKYGETVPMVAVYTHIDELSFYEFSFIKTIGNTISYTFIDAYWLWLGALIVIILYYKVVLYIIFGSKK